MINLNKKIILKEGCAIKWREFYTNDTGVLQVRFDILDKKGAKVDSIEDNYSGEDVQKYWESFEDLKTIYEECVTKNKLDATVVDMEDTIYKKTEEQIVTEDNFIEKENIDSQTVPRPSGN